MANSQPSASGGSSVPGAQIPILFGAVLALLGGSFFLFYQLYRVRSDVDGLRNERNQLRRELTQSRDQLLAEISRLQETSTLSTQLNKNTVDDLKRELETARRQSRQLVGDAQIEAAKHADELATRLEKMQHEQAQRVAAVSDAVSQIRTDTDAAKARLGEISGEVGSVKTDLVGTKAELEKTIATLNKTVGDLGIESGLIATNARELSALKALGERDYTEFRLPKQKLPQKVGDIQIRLMAVDPKKSRYTIEVIADDKKVPKKDKTINEPIQFILSRSLQPYELVVNEIKKDMIVGYLATPKTQQLRN